MTDFDLHWLNEPSSHFKSRRISICARDRTSLVQSNVFLPHIEGFWCVDITYPRNCEAVRRVHDGILRIYHPVDLRRPSNFAIGEVEGYQLEVLYQ